MNSRFASFLFGKGKPMNREEAKIRKLLIKLDTDRLPIKGGLLLVHLDPFGNIYPQGVRFNPNTITEAGDKCCADANSDRSENLFGYMEVGTTSGGKTTATNDLEGPTTPRARVAVDSRTQGTGGADNDVVWIATFPAGTPPNDPDALVEAGLFNATGTDPAVTYGDMYAYQEYSVINKGAADSLTATWTIQYGAS